ncbi:MAG: DUF2795 domain-containing protein [Dehalococcoidales bacterium]|nr:DUF2795 domain-containing protein [Dehalococcoidales bacterium]
MARVSPARVTQCLSGINFPCSKNDLIDHARQNNCSNDVLDTLRELPDTRYNSMADVVSGIGEVE